LKEAAARRRTFLAENEIRQRRVEMFTRRQALLGAVGAAALVAMPLGAIAGEAEFAKLPREKGTLVTPPFVHARDQGAKSGPTIVEYTMKIEEKPLVIDDEGTTLQAMTYNGSVPGPLMVVHQDDYVELTLVNPESNGLAHNIDFHAATGGLGGGELTL